MRSLVKITSGQLSPKVVVRWLAVTLEWPHAANAMIKRFGVMKTEEADLHGDALLIYLWKQLKSDYYAQGPVDQNPAFLEDLLNENGGWIDRTALDYLKDVTMNFSPHFSSDHSSWSLAKG